MTRRTGTAILAPPLSGSYSYLCQEARGCDVRSSGFAIDVAFALDGLGFSLAGGDPLGVDMARQFHQSLGDGAWLGLTQTVQCSDDKAMSMPS